MNELALGHRGDWHEAAKIHPDAQIVTSVRHYSDSLFSSRLTRPRSLRFRSGEFVMIGLMGENGRPLLRAYSIAAPVWDEELEFYSIKIENGPLTSRLKGTSDHLECSPLSKEVYYNCLKPPR